MDPDVCLSVYEGPDAADEHTPTYLYVAAVGALHYLADITRLDIAYAVGQLAHYLQNPSPAHWTACKRVYQYIKATKDYCLELGNNKEEELVGFLNTDGMVE